MAEEILVDLEALSRRLNFYGLGRIERIADGLNNQAQSIIQGKIEGDGATLHAVTAGDDKPVQQVVMDGVTVGLPAGAVSIGRSLDCDICISSDPQVSRLHATVTIHVSGTVTLRDLNSSNGTYVNGRRIREVRLNADDEIIVGQTKIILKGLPFALPAPPEIL